MAFSQSEKMKAGLIWVSQALEIMGALPESEKRGGMRIIKTMLDMMMHEIRLAKKMSGSSTWEDVEKYMDQAAIMIHSGVAAESVMHLTQALSRVTTIGQRSMSVLKEHELI